MYNLQSHGPSFCVCSSFYRSLCDFCERVIRSKLTVRVDNIVHTFGRCYVYCSTQDKSISQREQKHWDNNITKKEKGYSMPVSNFVNCKNQLVNNADEQ